MKIFLLAANEDWVCDRFVREWSGAFPDLMCHDPRDADVLWLLAGWCWRHIPVPLLRDKRVIVTVHHIVPDKFLEKQQREFYLRDTFVDCYHVPCKKTYIQIRKFTDKPIHIIPFWVNQALWKEMPDRAAIRDKYGINQSSFLLGSFQRDTEGHDLISPKLEKGPDLFCDAVEDIHGAKKLEGIETEVLLAGWRRQYVMSRLNKKGIKFYYKELPSFEILNELYNAIDLYVVASRYEGGPQAIVECASNRTPIISTDVGLAPEILGAQAIFRPGHVTEVSSDASIAHENVKKMWMPQGFEKFTKIFYHMSCASS